MTLTRHSSYNISYSSFLLDVIRVLFPPLSAAVLGPCSSSLILSALILSLLAFKDGSIVISCFFSGILSPLPHSVVYFSHLIMTHHQIILIFAIITEVSLTSARSQMGWKALHYCIKQSSPCGTTLPPVVLTSPACCASPVVMDFTFCRHSPEVTNSLPRFKLGASRETTNSEFGWAYPHVVPCVPSCAHVFLAQQPFPECIVWPWRNFYLTV